MVKQFRFLYTQKFGLSTELIMSIDHGTEIEKLTFRALVLCLSKGLKLKTSAFQSLYGDQFTSTPLINQIFVYHSPTDAAPQFLQKLIPFPLHTICLINNYPHCPFLQALLKLEVMMPYGKAMEVQSENQYWLVLKQWWEIPPIARWVIARWAMARWGMKVFQVDLRHASS